MNIQFFYDFFLNPILNQKNKFFSKINLNFFILQLLLYLDQVDAYVRLVHLHLGMLYLDCASKGNMQRIRVDFQVWPRILPIGLTLQLELQ